MAWEPSPEQLTAWNDAHALVTSKKALIDAHVNATPPTEPSEHLRSEYRNALDAESAAWDAVVEA